jgi:hypothetical protein
MKRLLFILLMMTSSVSWAEWEETGESESYVTYVDRATIRKKGNFVEMWNMRSYFESKVDFVGNKYRSTKDLRRYDCKEKTRGLVSLVSYSKENGKGTVVFSHAAKNNEVDDIPITPGSVNEALWKIACGRK